MEFICLGVFLFYIGGIVWQIATSLFEGARDLIDRIQDERRSRAAPALQPPTPPPSQPISHYRPRSSAPKARITFRDVSAGAAEVSTREIEDLVDALSGAALDPAGGLHLCSHCKVFYNAHSVEVIQAENGGRCVSCLRSGIVAVKAVEQGRNAEVQIVTLANYKQFVGRVITFEGLVHAVNVSQRGKDYAVMFENRAWVHGFKMVVFRRDVDRIGGRETIMDLENKRVRVRGLLVKDPTFGYEMIVSEPQMILRAQ